jgi:hypothetical protein
MDYLLRVMRDGSVEPARRDRAAALLMPYRHPRQAEMVVGKREQAMEAARTAGRGSHWEYTDANGKVVNLLDPHDGRQPDVSDDNGGWGDDLRFDPMPRRN